MANPYAPPRAGSNPYAPTVASSGSKKPKKSGGGLLRGLGAPIRFAGNLVTDVKDAVVGLPTGVIMTIRDPVGSAKAIGTTSWQTWSPLFHGHPGQFAENFYNHPLAPLLDIATVFTLGAGSAARGAGALSKAGVGGRVTEKVAGLRVPGEVKLTDPTDQGRHAVYKQLSGRAGRRLVQEGIMSLEGHLPQWVSSPIKRARFESRFAIDVAHRAAAKNLMLTTMLKAGEKLSDSNPDAPRARAEIFAGAHINLMRHNREIAVTPDEALARGIITKKGRVARNSPYTLIVDPGHFTGSAEHQSALARTQKQIARWNKQRERNAELAHELPRLRDELDMVNEELAKMHREGHVVSVPASKTRTPTPRQHMEQEAADILELQRRSMEIEQRIERANNAKIKHEEAVRELDVLINQRRELERRGFTEKYMSVSGSAADFEAAAGNFAKLTTTSRVAHAARTQDGKLYIVPRHDAPQIGGELKASASFLRKAWEKPTYLWKLAMIGYTPRSIVNNAVGNWAIFALREGGSVEGFKALYDAIRLTKGEDAALSSMRAATPFKRNNWLYRYFGTELGNVFGHELLEGSAKAKTKKALRAGLYPVVHKLADEPVRVASIAKFLRESPEVKALKAKGLSTDDAISRALRGNPSLQRRAAEHARVVAGDYFTLRNWERAVRDIIPFYLWDRHIVKTTGNLVFDTPGRVAVAQQISNMGVEETERMLGDIPEFLKGAIPLDMLGLGSEEGRKNVLLTASLNPWATIGEIAALGQALTIGGGQPRDALMGAHPFITGGIEFVTGRSVLTGAPKDTPGGLGLIFSVADNALSGLPMYRIGEALLSEDEDTTAAGNPRLYRRDDTAPISSFLGVPIRSVSPEAAARMAAQETDERKPKNNNPFLKT